MASLRELTTNFVKLERFDGGNFLRWSEKMKFLLTTLNVAYKSSPFPNPKKEKKRPWLKSERHKNGRTMTSSA
ncbi:hypothetical protein K1719_023324 [Acacia pycnantha]|nr:hypothetical protein K1719_023324 [Acacia pycnantha]